MSVGAAKRALFDELLLLMRQHGVEDELLALMQEPSWLERVSEENLRFLLDKHRELARLHEENAGLLDRWLASKVDRT